MVTVWVVAPEDPELATYFKACVLAEELNVDPLSKAEEALIDAFRSGVWPDALMVEWEALAYLARDFPLDQLLERIPRLAIYVAEPSSPLDPRIVDRPGVRVVYGPVLCRAAEETFRWLAGAPTGGPVSV